MNRDVHVTLAYCWGNRNAGDKAITSGTIGLLNRALGRTQITVLSIFSAGQEDFSISKSYLEGAHDNVTVIETPYPKRPSRLPKVLGIPIRMATLLFSLVFPRTYGKRLPANAAYHSLTQSDFVLFNTGHLFFWTRLLGERGLLAKHAYPLVIADRCGIPYGFYGQTLGPFEFSSLSIARRFFARLFRRSRFVFTRESLSRKILTETFPDAARTATVLDSAFFCTATDDDGADALVREAGLSAAEFIAVTTRLTRRGGRTSVAAGHYATYATNFARMLEAVVAATGLRILFVCQVPRDADDAREVEKLMNDNARAACVHTPHITSPGLLRSLYARSTVTLGMRFHSLIFAASVGTPVYGVHFEDISHKVQGLMTDLELGAYQCHAGEMDPDESAERVAELVRERDEFSRRILARIDTRRQNTVDTLRTALSSCSSTGMQ